EKVIKPRGRPAILRGVMRGWPATEHGRTSPQAMSAYLKTFYNGHPAPLFEAPATINGRFFYNDTLNGFNFESKRAVLSDVLDRLQAGLGREAAPALYAGSVSLPIFFPGFTATNKLDGLLNGSVIASIWSGDPA